MCFLIYAFAIKWAWKAPICFSVIEFIAMFLQVPCIIALLFCDSFVRFTASRLLPLANANLFGGDGFSRIRGNGGGRPASAGKNAVSVRGTISGPPVNRSEARPGLVSHAARQGPSPLEPTIRTGYWLILRHSPPVLRQWSASKVRSSR